MSQCQQTLGARLRTHRRPDSISQQIMWSPRSPLLVGDKELAPLTAGWAGVAPLMGLEPGMSSLLV